MRSTRDMDHEIQLPSKWTISKDAIALENRELSRNNVKYMRNYGA
jgi:aspartate carbamoyltransferase regulatory subunit